MRGWRLAFRRGGKYLRPDALQKLSLAVAGQLCDRFFERQPCNALHVIHEFAGLAVCFHAPELRELRPAAADIVDPSQIFANRDCVAGLLGRFAFRAASAVSRLRSLPLGSTQVFCRLSCTIAISGFFPRSTIPPADRIGTRAAGFLFFAAFIGLPDSLQTEHYEFVTERERRGGRGTYCFTRSP